MKKVEYLLASKAKTGSQKDMITSIEYYWKPKENYQETDWELLKEGDHMVFIWALHSVQQKISPQ